MRHLTKTGSEALGRQFRNLFPLLLLNFSFHFIVFYVSCFLREEQKKGKFQNVKHWLNKVILGLNPAGVPYCMATLSDSTSHSIFPV